MISDKVVLKRSSSLLCRLISLFVLNELVLLQAQMMPKLAQVSTG